MTPDTPSDPPLQHAKTSVGPFSYTDEGSGPVLLLIHGLPGSVRDFRWLAPTLAGFRIIRVDQPGFGDTPLSTEPSARVGPRVRFLQEVLTALKIDSAVALGHSFGGILATALAAAEPERIKGLALLASVGVTNHQGLRSFRWWPALSLALRIPPLRSRLMPRLREQYTRAGFPRSLPDEALIITVHRVTWFSFQDHKDRLGELRIPTLVAWTDDDPLVEVAISEALYWHCPPGPRVSFPTGGHNLQKTRAIELGQALSAWISQIYAA